MQRDGGLSIVHRAGLAPALIACLLALVAAGAGAEPPDGLSAECLAFRADIDANIGDIMRAGCEPTLAQMSKLMDSTSSTILVSSRTTGPLGFS